MKPASGQSLTEMLFVPGALRTNLGRWLERVSTTPPVLGRQLFFRALQNRHPAITFDLPGEPPLYVLGTGRSGTHTLARLLALVPGVQAWHEPMPDLHRLALQVYFNPDADRQIVSEAMLLARASLWQAANMAGKRYAESSYHNTFLAPFLLHMMPGCRFLHITRAPLPFANSATRFGWYSTPRLAEARIAPRPDTCAAADWEARDPFTKSVWLWQEVNRFAKEFLSTLPPGQGLHLRCEDIFDADPESLRLLFALVDSEPPSRRRIDRVLGQKLNAGRYRHGSGSFQEISAAQREKLQLQCRQLALELGYSGVDG